MKTMEESLKLEKLQAASAKISQMKLNLVIIWTRRKIIVYPI